MFRFFVLIFLIPLSSCQRQDNLQNQRTSDKSIAIETIILEKTFPLATVRLPGELYPYETVDIYAKLSGFIEDLYVDRGSEVKEGDILVKIIAPELISNWEEARAKFESDNIQYQRLKKAAEVPGTIAPIELETSQKKLEASFSNMQSLQELTNYLAIKAPFSGIITARYLHPGALVGAGGTQNATPIIHLEDVRRLRLVVYIPQAYLESIKEGMQVNFQDSAHPETIFSSRVSRISHALDPKTRTEAIELDVDNPNLILSSGRYVDVMWPISRLNPTFLVPPSAIITTTDRTFVIRIKGDTTEWVDVKRGYQYDHLVEIFGPLHEGDVLAFKATDELRPGIKVETASQQ